MKQAKKKIPALMEHTYTHTHTHTHTQENQKEGESEGEGEGREWSGCMSWPSEGIGLGPWWRQMQDHSSRM